MSKRNPLCEPKRMREFFTNLPSEIIVDILSRLPVRTIICCKCVCKPWLSLLETEDFAKFHLSKSVPGLAAYGREPCKLFEIEDVLDLERHELHYIPVTEFESPRNGFICGSADGLLFLNGTTESSRTDDLCILGTTESSRTDDLCILNPITRDYIQIPSPREFGHIYLQVYGFGAGRITGQHKIVRIFHICTSLEETDALCFLSSECQVYTLGTGLWRSITPSPTLEYDIFPLEHFSMEIFIGGVRLKWLPTDFLL